MNSLLKHHYILGLGLVIGIFLATLTIVEKNNLSDQNWAAKIEAVSYTHLRAHETLLYSGCPLLV